MILSFNKKLFVLLACILTGSVFADKPDNQKLCELGDGGACVEESFNSTQPEIWNKKACDLNNAIGCANLAASFYSKGNIDESLPLFSQACDLKDSISCTNLGLIEESRGNLKEATLALGKACLKGGDGPSCVSWKNVVTRMCSSHFDSCLQVASIYTEEKGSIGDDYFMYRIACKNGHTPACKYLDN